MSFYLKHFNSYFLLYFFYYLMLGVWNLQRGVSLVYNSSQLLIVLSKSVCSRNSSAGVLAN